MARGKLRVYLGAAPGVGKTYAMLDEARRRHERGTDVVVGFVEAHGRVHTAERIEGLEVVPRQTVSYRGTTFEEMDPDAILARRPDVVAVDELAHTNVPGCRHEKRWQDVDDLLAAGIHVISTVNIQHLESLNDVVESITGVRQRETIPDAVVRRADQVELVDMTPEALRRRMAHGNIYQPDKIDAALSHYFRPGNLTALRELALLWLADRVDEALESYRSEHGISATWPTRERVVVALSGGPEGETLLRRGARIAARGAGGELIAVYVARSDGLIGGSPDALARQRQLTAELGGRFQTIVGDDVAEAVLEFARTVNASRIVVGVSRYRAVTGLFRRSVGAAVVDGSGEIDVHVVTHELARSGGGRRPTADGGLSHSRRAAGWAMALVAPPVLTALLHASRDLHGLPTQLMLFMTLSVGCALVGGLWPAIVSAVLASLFLNYFFTPPFYTFTIADPENAFALVTFVIVASAVATVVDLAARRSLQAARARAEADLLSGLAQSLMRADDQLPVLVEEMRRTFNLGRVSVLRRDTANDTWDEVAAAGPEAATTDQLQPLEFIDVPINDTVLLRVQGKPLSTSENRLLMAYAAHTVVILERSELTAKAAAARELELGNRTRTALLAAVSHDLRTPLASIKAAVTSLRQPDMVWSPEDEAALLETVEESADRLDALIDNLLDMSRLQADAVRPKLRAVSIDEVLPAALAGLADRSAVRFEAEDEAWVTCDPGLLERVLANVLENAVRYSPIGSPVVISPGRVGDRLHIRVVDTGPGVPEEAKEFLFAPFQRLGDVPAGSGVGLGLAVARGLTEAMGGQIWAEDTP
ncbi:MAG: DUF4118 domain-containing protein, partial [Nocardioidaceae bacterium]